MREAEALAADEDDVAEARVVRELMDDLRLGLVPS